MNPVHKLRNPTGIALDELGSVGHGLRLREEPINRVDTIGSGVSNDVAILGVVDVILENAPHGVALLGVANDGVHSIVENLVGVIGSNEIILVKHIVLHIVLLRIRRVRITAILLESLTDESIHNSTLLLSHAIDNVLDGTLRL